MWALALALKTVFDKGFGKMTKRYLMSRYMWDAFSKGYTNMNIGLLCWAPISAANLRPSTIAFGFLP